MEWASDANGWQPAINFDPNSNKEIIKEKVKTRDSKNVIKQEEMYHRHQQLGI